MCVCVCVCLCVLVCNQERCNLSFKGELWICGGNFQQTDKQECGSYPAEPSLVICALVFCFQLFSPLPCLHPSLCSQCHISPQVTSCPPNSNVSAPYGIHPTPRSPQHFNQTAIRAALQLRRRRMLAIVLLILVAGK